MSKSYPPGLSPSKPSVYVFLVNAVQSRTQHIPVVTYGQSFLHGSFLIESV